MLDEAPGLSYDVFFPRIILKVLYPRVFFKVFVSNDIFEGFVSKDVFQGFVLFLIWTLIALHICMKLVCVHRLHLKLNITSVKSRFCTFEVIEFVWCACVFMLSLIRFQVHVLSSLVL